jgi:lipopolysaccharide transport system permease protein
MEKTNSASIRALIRDVAQLAYFNVYRRYCGSFLGVGWSLLSPLATIAAYYLVFKIFFRVPIEYFAIYLSAGLMPWLCLVNSVTASAIELTIQREVLENNLRSPVVYLFAAVIAEWSFLVISYVALAIVIILAGLGTWKMLALPIFLLPLFVFTIASGIIVGYLGVHFRDIPHLLRVFFQGAFWFVPIVYHWSLVPQELSGLVQYNPFSLLISPSQIILHGDTFPSLILVLSGTLLAVGWSIVAIFMHRKLGSRIVYHL